VAGSRPVAAEALQDSSARNIKITGPGLGVELNEAVVRRQLSD
jgi:hypothetical protein